MAKFPEQLNKDGQDYLTSARFDAGANAWLHDSAQFIKKNGIWVPWSDEDPAPVEQAGAPWDVRVTAQATLPVAQTGALPAGAAEIGAVKQGTAGAETAPWPVKQTDRIAAAPVVGAKTISTSAAELFAGASRLANRISMTVYNESTTTVYFGPAGVTTATGFPLLPGDSVTFQFRPSTATAIYGIGAASSAVRVVEFA